MSLTTSLQNHALVPLAMACHLGGTSGSLCHSPVSEVDVRCVPLLLPFLVFEAQCPQKAARGGKNLFHHILPGNSSSPEESRAGPWRQGSKQTLQRNAAYSWLSLVCSVTLLTVQTHLPRLVMPNVLGLTSVSD